MSLHILIADRDAELAEAVAWYVRADGRRVTVAGDEHATLAALTHDPPQAAIVELSLLCPEGLAALREARAQSCLPLLLVAAASDPAANGRALGPGPHDVAPAPAGAMELVARLRTLLQRAGLADKAPPHRADLRLDAEAGAVVVGAQTVPLPAPEFRLLACLMRQPHTVLSRSQLADAIWGDDFYGDLRLVDNHVCRLRARLREAGVDPMPIATARGAGYAFRPGP